MKGFSLSLLKLNDLFEKALHEDVETLGWQKPMAFAPLRTVAHSAIHDRVEYTPSENPQVAGLCVGGYEHAFRAGKPAECPRCKSR